MSRSTWSCRSVIVVSASRVGLTPSPTCLTRQGGFPQGRCGHIGNDTGRSECQPSFVKPMEGFSMAKYTYLGWYKPGDKIPQPIGVVLGGNLKQGSKPPSPPPKQEDKPEDK